MTAMSIAEFEEPENATCVLVVYKDKSYKLFTRNDLDQLRTIFITYQDLSYLEIGLSVNSGQLMATANLNIPLVASTSINLCPPLSDDVLAVIVLFAGEEIRIFSSDDFYKSVKALYIDDPVNNDLFAGVSSSAFGRRAGDIDANVSNVCGTVLCNQDQICFKFGGSPERCVPPF